MTPCGAFKTTVWLGVTKTRKIKKVTTSQDDDFVGGAVLQKAKGRRPLVAFLRTSSDRSASTGKNGLGSCRMW